MLNFDVIYGCSGGGPIETTTQVPGAKTTESSGGSNETETNAPLPNTTMHSNGTYVMFRDIWGPTISNYFGIDRVFRLPYLL